VLFCKYWFLFCQCFKFEQKQLFDFDFFRAAFETPLLFDALHASEICSRDFQRQSLKTETGLAALPPLAAAAPPCLTLWHPTPHSHVCERWKEKHKFYTSNLKIHTKVQQSQLKKKQNNAVYYFIYLIRLPVVFAALTLLLLLLN